ncbi:MAG: aspartate--tRNA ligase [Elusimicrobia bacterium]|nr:aspartate--tRNA ligase [Elusimicrobiota bacterium]
MLRTHTLGQIGPKMIGQRLIVAGWAHTIRDHGGVLFIDLRDRSGLLQLVFRDERLGQEAKSVGLEFVLQAEGTLQGRPSGTENPDLPTGSVELVVDRFKILNTSKPPPFPISSKTIEAGEETRLKYRYLDLRRPKMTRAMEARHEFCQAVRSVLNREKFWEIETPILTKSTPEGARDFLVPCRMMPGNFYALPQSPQIFKQMLMVSGMDRYYQIARCFRDEDLRADRQPEFTQIDLEMSFVDTPDVMDLVEGLVAESLDKAFGVKLKLPFERLGFEEVMSRYQTDKPDLRFRAYERRRLNEFFQGTQFKVFSSALNNGKVIAGLTIPQAASTVSRSELDRSVELAKALGAQGLIWMKIAQGAIESPVEKFLSAQEKERLLSITRPNDLLLICAEEPNMADRVLKELQKRLAGLLNHKPDTTFAFCWVQGFPLLEYLPENKRWQATHNPFTAPMDEDVPLLKEAPHKVRSKQYDLVMNGVELGSGSIRNHTRSLQEKLFSLMGYEAAEAQERFGWMLDALEHGAPPHGGIALGVDRLVALMLGEESIREVIAFPKTQRGTCPFSGAPSSVDAKQLKELGIKLAG